MQTIDVKRLAEEQRRFHVDVIDVRMPTEFREIHAQFARNVPLDSLDPHEVLASRNGAADQPLFVICRSGNRSAQACKKFIDAGFENIVNVEGGTTAWDKAGLPVVRGKKAFPLTQQVQLTAGFLVLLGVVLAYFVHPYFAGLSAFVGAGLMFAGATGACPMASGIARMPWNQCGGGGSCLA
ncbi:Rhodanese-related sulfurtransferase [Neorhodopirellula lusitana]|uniref:Rhodanese-related sulfurtransferase n=1 Tax=Neorhodopirellula lusitana TaxID=445327 RepID=A0ABY1Q8U0_9BACT|nr:rhodanese-like domain-containing protein [Neorhodopirellula lusitana]SMP61012.1 Rhodanese-related sulfurtransferase [Neorhodopirellula lusitana]